MDSTPGDVAGTPLSVRRTRFVLPRTRSADRHFVRDDAVRTRAGWSALPFSALVVEPDEADREFIASTLTAARFNVTAANNFSDAKTLLVAHPPMVLVTEIRLDAHNGLQLALRGLSMRPHMMLVVTSAFMDPVLQHEAERFGATFVPKPVAASELVAAVYRTALRQPNPDGTLEPIRAPFERRQDERRHGERRRYAAVSRKERRQVDRRRGIAGLLNNPGRQLSTE
jgi:DNA-binding NtrC family response regulator